MQRDPATAAGASYRGSPRFLLAAYATMVGGYLGLALAAIGVDWTLATGAGPGPFIAIPLAAAGIALTVIAWHALYRLYDGEDEAVPAAKSADRAKPSLNVVHGLPAASSH